MADTLTDVPFEVLQTLRSDGTTLSRTTKKVVKEDKGTKMKRANKNRPMEITSKKQVGRYREVIQDKHKVSRDPRFESMCGTYQENKFKEAYSFIYDDQLPAERTDLLRKMKKEKDPERKKEISAQLRAVEQQLKGEEQRRKLEVKEKEETEKQVAAIKEGKRPFFLKKSEKKKQELINMYKELKASGKLEAFISKKRRKNASKEHRKVPLQRVS
eukprot:TRINITY_DN3256_c0_g1_i1.p1 TRINITY_DN3256_c0_g1~~TRINITY_DN3256_c0_g1_i1.p1  ORF type:complete len:215 (-),score=57.83 TRINITY_DN3256_c0_g1_i1:246-890(-)